MTTMKTQLVTTILTIAGAAALQAGPMMTPYDAMAQQAPMPGPTGCEAFEGGWALAPFGLFLTPDSDTDTTFGFGLQGEYFFNRYLGLAASAQWGEVNDIDVGNYMADAVVRYPFPTACLAPYAFAGIGLIDAETTELLGRLGIGIDWRIYNGHGIFCDWSYAIPGGGGGDDDIEDYQLIRFGVKIDF